MMGNSWDDMAAWLDEKHSDIGDLWHRALIDPVLLRLVGDVNHQQVLEVACGNGYLSRRFARMGAQVTSVDASVGLIERAQAREMREPLGIVYHVSDAASLSMLDTGSFDLVVCNMALMDMADAASSIGEIARALRSNGRFVASLEHPCFEHGPSTAWVLEQTVSQPAILWRKVSHYREVAPYTINWNRQQWQTTTYHRPLAWYMQALRTAGFALTALEEPSPQDEFLSNSSQGAWIAEIPLHIVFEARKIAQL
jgi:2-polyprenyl-3-methyl-5-hydroxy-6-metoxy-1,4-benzoquinol methylase